MGTRVRARVLIPTLLFLVVTLPALLIPIVSGHESGPELPPESGAGGADPLDRDTGLNQSDFKWRVPADEVSENLDRYLGGG